MHDGPEQMTALEHCHLHQRKHVAARQNFDGTISVPYNCHLCPSCNFIGHAPWTLESLVVSELEES